MKRNLLIFICIIFVIVTVTLLIFNISRYKLQGDLQYYLQTYFPDQRLINISSADKDELAKFVITQAMCHGMVYPANYDISNNCYILEIDKIEKNIRRITGNNSIILRINLYDLISINDNNQGVFKVNKPEYNFIFVIHNLKKIDESSYTATLTYINTIDTIYTYSYEGDIISINEVIVDCSTFSIDEQLDRLEKEIRKNPDQYEIINFTFKYYNGKIYYLAVD